MSFIGFLGLCVASALAGDIPKITIDDRVSVHMRVVGADGPQNIEN